MTQIEFQLTRQVHQQFSVDFKRQVVAEFEAGLLNKDQLQRKYGLKGKSIVLNWCRKYGKFAYSQPIERDPLMKDAQKERIKELEKKLKEAELKALVYSKVIEVTNRQLKTDVIKKIEAELPKNWQKKLKK